jgi:hypothetical protein
MEKKKTAFGRTAKKVKCIDTDTGKIVAEYGSVTEASKAIGKLSARASILNVCNGYQETAYGYKWQYAE